MKFALYIYSPYVRMEFARVFRHVAVRSGGSRKEIFKSLRSVELFHCLSFPQIQRLTDLLKENTYQAGEYIIRQGDVGETFYVLLEGQCDCTINQQDGTENIVFQPKVHDYFGEKALLTSSPRAANVVARSAVKVNYF
jgi:cAMP-dependent protein kinase regulator